jgi:hypothetical protein
LRAPSLISPTGRLSRTPKRRLPPLAAALVQADDWSPTIGLLERSRLLDPLPIYATCPRSRWFASSGHLKCQRRLLVAVRWSQEPKPTAACDGRLRRQTSPQRYRSRGEDLAAEGGRVRP